MKSAIELANSFYIYCSTRMENWQLFLKIKLLKWPINSIFYLFGQVSMENKIISHWKIWKLDKIFIYKDLFSQNGWLEIQIYQQVFPPFAVDYDKIPENVEYIWRVCCKIFFRGQTGWHFLKMWLILSNDCEHFKENINWVKKNKL